MANLVVPGKGEPDKDPTPQETGKAHLLGENIPPDESGAPAPKEFQQVTPVDEVGNIQEQLRENNPFEHLDDAPKHRRRQNPSYLDKLSRGYAEPDAIETLVGRDPAGSNPNQRLDKLLKDRNIEVPPDPEQEKLKLDVRKKTEEHYDHWLDPEKWGGIPEAGIQAVGGLTDVVQETYNFGVDIMNTVSDLNLDKTDFSDQLIPRSDDVEDRLIRGAVGFLVPFAGYLKGMKAFSLFQKTGATASFVRSSVAGMAADFANTDPKAQSFLFGWLKENVEFARPVAEYLVADGDDSALEGRLKKSIAGIFEGALGDALFKSISVVRGLRRANKATKILDELPKKDDVINVEGVAKDQPPPVPGKEDVGAKPLNEAEPPPLPPDVKAQADLKARINKAKDSVDASQRDKKLNEMLSDEKIPKNLKPDMTPEETAEFLLNKNDPEVLLKDKAFTVDITAYKGQEDIQNIMLNMASKYRDLLEQGKRVESHSFVKEVADRVGVTPEELLKMDTRNYNHTVEETIMQRIQGGAALDLHRVSKLFNEGKIELDTFLNAEATFREIFDLRKNFGSEMGRNLRNLRSKVVKKDIQRAKELRELQQMFGDDPERMAYEISRLDKKHVPKVISSNIYRGWKHVQQARVNYLLSNPVTHMRNHVSTGAATLTRIPETGMKVLVDTVTMQGKSGTQAVELVGQIHGMFSGIADAMRIMQDNAVEGVKFVGKGGSMKGGGNFRPLFQDPKSKLAGLVDIRDTSEFVQDFGQKDALGKLGEVLTHMLKGTPVGKMLTEGDNFWKLVNARMTAHQQAARTAKLSGSGKFVDDYTQALQAVTDVLPSGKSTLKPIADIQKINPAVGNEILESSRQATFTNELPKRMVNGEARGGALDHIKKAIQNNEVLNTIFPFVGVNMNTMIWKMERTPGLNMFLGHVRDDMLSGNALKRNAQIAKMSTSALMLGGIYSAFVQDDSITGSAPKDFGERRLWKTLGYQENSIKVGGEWISYEAFFPQGQLLSLISDVHQTAQSFYDDPHLVNESASIMSGIVANYFTPEFLVNFSGNFFDLLSKGEGRGMKQFLTQQPTTFVPYNAMLRNLRKSSDPYQREVGSGKKGAEGFIEEIRNEFWNAMPGFSEGLKPRRNMFGDVLLTRPALGSTLISPFVTSEMTKDPTYLELDRLMELNRLVPNRPDKQLGEEALALRMPKKNNMDLGRPLTAKEYDEVIQYASGIHPELKKVSGHKTLKNIMDTVMKSSEYRDAPDQVKMSMLRDIYSTMVSGQIKHWTFNDEGRVREYKQRMESLKKQYEVK